jgi:hypothetical protein
VTLERTYLYVPPEEGPEVEALGARWDAKSKTWYLGPDADASRFTKWLTDGQDDGQYTILSERAFVASASAPCWKCHLNIEVICIYCESGIASGEPLVQFSISNVWATDSGLAQQLEPWRTFRNVYSAGDQESYFANHCPHCGALQDDLYLHSEPDQPFFDIPHSAPGTVKLTPLVGRIQLSGDESFEI